MCVVSMITQHYWEKYPNPYQFPIYRYGEMQELLRKARLYDELTGQEDCIEPAKDAWLQKVEIVMKRDPSQDTLP